MAFNTLPDAEKVSNQAVLEKTRAIINDSVQHAMGVNRKSKIANGIQLKHINEYMDSIEAIPAPPPSQSSSSSPSSSSSGARRLGTEAVWRIENYNREKRPRKFNSWVANRPKGGIPSGPVIL